MELDSINLTFKPILLEVAVQVNRLSSLEHSPISLSSLLSTNSFNNTQDCPITESYSAISLELNSHYQNNVPTHSKVLPSTMQEDQDAVKIDGTIRATSGKVL
jgi:hypothetical protein